MVLACSMTIPLLLAIFYKESTSVKAFAEVAVFCAVLGGLIQAVLKPAHSKLKVRDGFFIVSVTWLLCSVIGAMPFFLSGGIPSLADAVFESCSGFSTTGASILNDIEALPSLPAVLAFFYPLAWRYGHHRYRNGAASSSGN